MKESENDDATNFDDLEEEAAAEEESAEDNAEVDEEYQDEVIEYENEVEGTLSLSKSPLHAPSSLTFLCFAQC